MTALGRRSVLKTLATSALLLDGGCDQSASGFAMRQSGAGPTVSPISVENQLPGDGGFALEKPGSEQCEVYCSVVSAAAGDTVDVFASTDRVQGVSLDLYRIGYYQGLGARLVSSLARVTASRQTPRYNLDKSTGLLECGWTRTFSLEIDPDYVTGYYLIKITNDDGLQSHVPFIVRETGRTAPLLVQASVTTPAGRSGSASIQ